jgi:hypothetical protein
MDLETTPSAVVPPDLLLQHGRKRKGNSSPGGMRCCLLCKHGRRKGSLYTLSPDRPCRANWVGGSYWNSIFYLFLEKVK